MIKVGCCGYPVSQTKYYEAFSLVELNSTFYRYPGLKTVEGWRKRAPSNFEFTVKAHQDISHRYRLKIEETIEPFERVKQICHILEAKIILIQTPASFTVRNLSDAEKFFKNTNRENFILVWETRGPSWESEEGLSELKETLSELNVTHVTDPLRLMPTHVSDAAYFRLHGLGERLYYYQYTDDELRKLYGIIRKFEGLKMGVYVLFNNLSMFDDARRFKSFIEDNCFPPLTGNFGLEATKVALISSVRYPATKKALIDKVGWKLIEAEPGRQVRLSEILSNIPERTYRSLDEVLGELKEVL